MSFECSERLEGTVFIGGGGGGMWLRWSYLEAVHGDEGRQGGGDSASELTREL